MNTTLSMLPIGGTRITGQEVRNQNVMAVQSIANIVKSSLGPVGLDKMLVDERGDVVMTNDGATMLSLLDVTHPAAKMLVELATQQDKEVGDGTTSVVLLAAELLKQANELVKLKVHPTTVISGYRMALKEACKFMAEQQAVRVDSLQKDALLQCAKTCLASKVLGAGGLIRPSASLISGVSSFPPIPSGSSGAMPISSAGLAIPVSFEDHFAQMAVDAMHLVRRTGPKGEPRYPVSAVNILKAHGQSQLDSQLIQGYALNCSLASPMMKQVMDQARIACLDMNLQKVRMPLGIAVVVENPDALEAIRQREADMTRERIQKILAAGANVILTTKGIDDASVKVIAESGALAVRRVAKEDLVRIAKATGATVLSSLATLEGDEGVEAGQLGIATQVAQIRVGDGQVVVVRGPKQGGAVSLLLRGANDTLLDEMERAMHDALCIVSRTLSSHTVVAGGGAADVALAVHLDAFALTLGSREQLAVARYSDSLLTLPKTLATNAAKDATALVAALRARHYSAQTSRTSCHDGLDLFRGAVRDNLQAGVIEPTLVKLKALKAATEAAISILRIDDLIKLEKPAASTEQDHCD